ncbi:MAG: TlpA family protein disulfide reductase [Bacteroidetes bacterium]|nr:TlpA family protein disulfide reductase [Bacteroidota bacterium]
MIKRFFKSGLLYSILFLALHSSAQTNLKTYRAVIHRPDGNEIPFTLLDSCNNKKTSWIITNSTDRIRLNNIHRAGDSLIVLFPVFESQFHVSVNHDDVWDGYWYKAAANGLATQSLSIYRNQDFRFIPNPKKANHNITGRWAVTFTRANNTTRQSVAEFVQDGNKLTGTFLNRSGDYRFLEGIVSGDSLMLSIFDGSHAYAFYAVIDNENQISNGLYCSGTANKEKWVAVKNADAKLPGDPSELAIHENAGRLNFSFVDLDGKKISINDRSFKNKVVILQLLGSWCPNCMDETAFLSDFYNKNKSRGVEVIGLAYEYSEDIERSKKSVQKFRDRFSVKYPLLITGVTSGDSLRTEKTLPQLKKIESFPSTIFIDRTGRIKRIHTGFNGPATGVHYEEEKKFFEEMVDELLQ